MANATLTKDAKFSDEDVGNIILMEHVNVQIDDMVRGVHEHLEFGTGEIDFPPVLRALRESGYRGLVAVELPRLLLGCGEGAAVEDDVAANLTHAQLLHAAWASPLMPDLAASLPAWGLDGTTRRGRRSARSCAASIRTVRRSRTSSRSSTSEAARRLRISSSRLSSRAVAVITPSTWRARIASKSPTTLSTTAYFT